MATTIQNIELPKKPRARDTSGNNNHGKIYSGRGLEFDGVTDYLQVPASAETDFAEGVPYTWSTWVNFAGFDTWFLGLNRSHPNVMAITSGQLAFREAGANAAYYYLSSTKLNLNTWYRLVVTADASNNMRLYINGVLDHTLSEGDSPYSGSGTFGVGGSNLGTDFQILRIGSGYSNNAYGIEGMMSNFQVWDKAWTATDVAYDYLNPESLALNASGTALTESNLKLWYPMQDGHRGQQSYILDGANTGLGEEMVQNGSFDNGTTNWIKGSATSSTQEIINGALRMYTGDGSASPAGNSNTLSRTSGYSMSGVSGVKYRLRVTASDFSAGTGSIRLDGVYLAGAAGSIKFSAGTQDVYFVAYRDFSYIKFMAPSHSHSYTIDNVSLKPINDKHHATTVFYGDTLWDTAASTNGNVDNWNAFGNNTVATDTGMVKGTYVDNASGVYIYLKDSADLSSDLTVGRTYQFQYDIKVNTGSVTPVMGLSGGTSYSGAAVTSTDLITQTIDFTCAHATLHFFYVGGMGTGEIVYLDNFSLKEVGVASGWTDADQQLHIPQTALQSYNELAWFDGVADYVTIADHDDLSFDAFSVSAWINMNDATNFPVISKGSYNSTAEFLFLTEGADKLKLYIMDESVSNCYIGRATAALTSSESEWLHVVGTYDGGTASSGVKLYINGVQSDDANAESNPGSFVAMENLGAAVTIGKYNSHYANGCITETSLWDKELSSTEVLELFNDGKALDALTHSASSDIKGYWRNNGLSTWTDLSTNSNNGTPTSVTETILIPEGVDATRDSQGFLMNKKRSTGSLNLDGVGYASLPTMAVTTDDFTFEAWAKAESNITHESVIMEVGASMLLFGNNHGYIRAVDGTFTNQLPTHSFVLGNWYHIVVTRIRNGNQIMYVDGVAKNTVTAPDTAMTLSDTTIGKDNTTRTSSDVLDAVKVYSAALSATEVLQNYNATKRDHKN